MVLTVPVSTPSRAASIGGLLLLLFAFAGRAAAQTMPEHMHETEPSTPSWHLMQDGVVFMNLNHQGGPRGGTEQIGRAHV